MRLLMLELMMLEQCLHRALCSTAVGTAAHAAFPVRVLGDDECGMLLVAERCCCCCCAACHDHDGHVRAGQRDDFARLVLIDWLASVRSSRLLLQISLSGYRCRRQHLGRGRRR